MSTENNHRERELRIQRQIAFASGLFQGDVTVRTLLESLAEGVVIIDTSGTILLVNAAAEKMFGFSKKELIGSPHAVIIPEQFRKVHEEHEAGYFNKPGIRPMGQLLDLYGRRRDGSEFPVEISLGFIETINGVLVLALVSDMTLRKQFETRLKEAEELFHVQVECVKDYAVFMLDAGGNVLNWNAGAERLKGYRDEEIIGKHFSCFYPEKDRSAGNPSEMLTKAVAEGRVEDEGWRIRKDGSRFWADVMITAIRDEKGNLRGFSKVTHDITSRKKTENALRFSEGRYRTLFRDNPTMIVTLDTELTMLSINPACACQLGYTIDEMEGQSVLMLFHEDDRSVVAEQLGKCLQNQNQVHRWQFRKIRKDGSLLWVEETAQAMYDLNGSLNILVVCQDITERKRLEEELKQASRQNELILSSAGEGIVGLDLEGNHTFVNSAAAAMLGYEANELVGKHSHSTWHYALPDGGHYPKEKCPVYAAYKDGTTHSGEEMFLRKDGTSFPVQYTSRPIYSGEKIVGAVLTFNDITERKRAEKALQESEERFRATFNQAAVGIGHVAPDGLMLRVNQKFCDIIGYTEEEFKSLTVKDITHPDDLEKSMQHFQLLLEGKLGNYSLEKRYIRKDGSPVWVNVTASMMFDAAGNPSIGVGVVEDITARKKMEADLKESEQRFASFMLHLPAAAWMKDLHGRYVYANAEAERIFSTPLAALQGKTDEEIFPPETVRHFQGNDARIVVEGGSLQTTEALRQADGIEHYSIVSKFAVPGSGGQTAYVAGVALDVTDRRRAEEALRKSELKLSKIFNTVPALIVITTMGAGKCIEINEAGLRALGFRREEMIGRSMLELGIWESRSARERVIRVLEENGLVRDMEIKFRNREGKTLIGNLSTDLVDFNGDRYVLSIVNDITERKLMEEEIERLNTVLWARAAELEAANRELEAFNYSVAHDLRNPLNVITSYCQAIDMLCGGTLDEQCNGYLREAYDAALRMDRLIGDLLNFSRLAHAEPRREMVDLCALANEVATMLKLTKPERQVDFRIMEGIAANADANLLRVALDNLLGNAWKYTGMREQAVIEFGMMEIDGVPTYFVRDNGNGFDMADAEKLFVPFQRLPGAEEFRGFGIGLASVERIIRRHGGRIWAEGRPGIGATFWFTLPS